MLIHYAVMHLAAHAAYPLADGGPVDNPGPSSPVSSAGVDLLLGYAKWGALVACAVSALISGGMMAVGQLSSRPDHADRGKRALLWSLGGAAVVALAIPTLNTVFGTAG
jgi:hypothetical protein